MLKNYHALFIRSTNCRNNNLTFSNSIKEINLFISPNMLFLYVRHWQTNYDFLWLLISNNVGKTLWLIKAWKEKNQFISSNMFFPAPIWSYKNLIISLHRVLPNNINVHPFNILHSLRIRTLAMPGFWEIWIHPPFPKGRMALPKRMNFRKNSKRPLTPPPSFLGNHIADFATKVRMFLMAGLL